MQGMREAVVEKRFVLGRRFSDAVSSWKRVAPFGARSALAILLALMFSTYAFAETGAETYKTKCSACHGANGAGDTMIGKNLKLRPLGSDEVQKQSDEEFFSIINKGKNRMPAFDGKLSRDQIRDLVKYVRFLKK